MSESLETNLSSSPYFDDFDVTKDFVKVLFIPSRPVQTRELNQVQSLLQTQVTRFADHVFKEGSVVSGVSVSYVPQQKYVHVSNLFVSNTDLTVLDITSDHVLVSNTGIRATPRVSVRGFEAQYPATNRFYVDYLTTGRDGSNNDISEFTAGETLTVYNANQSKLGSLVANNILDTISVISSNTATGTAYAVAVSDGIIYQKGYFVRVAPQIALVKEYDTNTASYAVGFKTVESIITEDNDESLYSNASGEPNFNGPGAHRLKLVPTLVSVDKTAIAANTTFFPIVEFDNSVPVEEHTDSVYAALGDALGVRTFEESGNYTTTPFTVETLQHANTSQMYYQASPGVAYVNGSRVELIGPKRVAVDRAITTAEGQSQIVTANYGNYVIVDEASGIFDFDTQPTVSIYDAAQDTLTDVESAGAAPTGNLVGNAEVRGYEFSTGTPGLANAQYKLYITNIKMASGKSFLNDAKSFYVSGTSGFAKADVVLESSQAKIQDAEHDSLIFPIGVKNIRRLTDKLGVNDTQFIFRDAASATMQTNGFVTVTTNSPYAGGTERINASVGTLADGSETDFTLVLGAAGYSANLTGTITTGGTNTATGTGTCLLYTSDAADE